MEQVGRSKEEIGVQLCKSIDNQQQKTRVIEYRSGVYKLGIVMIFFKHLWEIWKQSTSDNIRRSDTWSVGKRNRYGVSDSNQLKIDRRRLWWLREDQGSINWEVYIWNQKTKYSRRITSIRSVGGSNTYIVSNANQLTTNIISTGWLRIDQGSINWGVQVQGKFSKRTEIFENRRPGTTAEDQILGQWEQAIDMGSELWINWK